jgi:sarcosine oxidase
MAVAMRAEVAVVGCGAMGIAACRSLAKRGVAVLGLERHQVAHANGSSHGGTRVFREAYFEHPDYVPLLRRAREGFLELEQESGERLLERCGTLLVGPPGSAMLRDSHAAAKAHGIPVELLGPAELASRHPQFGGEAPGRVGLWEPGGGFVRPERTIRAMAATARRRGATIVESGLVRRIEERGDRVEIELASETVVASRAIVAGGAWAAGLLAMLGMPLPLVATRQVQAWLAPADPSLASSARMPAWLVDRGDAPPFYGVPIDPLAGEGVPGAGLAKVALHGGGAACEPDRVERGVAPAELAEIGELAHSLLGGLAGRVAAASVCLYTNTPDGHFVVDRSPGGRVAFACGFSGHGFKFAPAIGDALADLALHGESRLPIGFLRASRLQRG